MNPLLSFGKKKEKKRKKDYEMTENVMGGKK